MQSRGGKRITSFRVKVQGQGYGVVHNAVRSGIPEKPEPDTASTALNRERRGGLRSVGGNGDCKQGKTRSTEDTTEAENPERKRRRGFNSSG